MSNSTAMKVLEQVYDLSDIEHSDGLVEVVNIGSDELDELPSLTVFQDEVEGLLVLEGVVELDDTRVLDGGKKFLLNHSLVLLLLPL